MKIFVTAKPRAREENIKQIDPTHFEISVKEPPIQGKANSAIIRVLADYLGVSISQIKLMSGFSSRQKIFSVS